MSEDDTGIELRIVPDLGAVSQRVIGSTLEFSGIRLRNLQLPASATSPARLDRNPRQVVAIGAAISQAYPSGSRNAAVRIPQGGPAGR